jgi:hypothetical protein
VEQLDKILSGDGAVASEPGAKTADTAATPPTETTKTTEQTEQHDDVTETPDGRKTVPLEALTEARGKVKRYTEEVADFRKSNENLQRQVTELLTRIPQQQQPTPPQAPDFFENPAGATRHEVESFVSPQFEQINRTMLAFAKDNAITRFTEEKVNEAEQAFIGAMQSKTLDPAEYHKVVGSPNRYAAAVQWHQRKLAEQEIGGDPAAFKEKVRTELEAEILAKHGLAPDGGKPANTGTPAVMPSNLAGARNVGTRAGPAWSGPAPLTDIFKR